MSLLLCVISDHAFQAHHRNEYVYDTRSHLSYHVRAHGCGYGYVHDRVLFRLRAHADDYSRGCGHARDLLLFHLLFPYRKPPVIIIMFNDRYADQGLTTTVSF